MANNFYEAYEDYLWLTKSQPAGDWITATQFEIQHTGKAVDWDKVREEDVTGPNDFLERW